jgi:hypothetical protein
MSPERGLNEGRWLERALLFTFAAHLLAMFTMGLFLAPALPGGSGGDAMARVAYVAHHPWLLRIGWSGWQLTALSDLLLACALLVTPWVSRPAAVMTLLFTLFALVPDQYNQWRWDVWGPALAERGLAGGDLGPYLRFEAESFRYIAGWGPVGYLGAAIGWTWCFAAAGVWARGLTWLSWATWGIFAVATGVVLFGPNGLPGAWGVAVSAGNGIAFVLLMVWLAWAGELTFRRVRPYTTYGSLAVWKYPGEGVLAKARDLVANSHFVRAAFRCCPGFAMASDITDVIYVNYLVEAETLARLVPEPLRVQRLGPGGRYAMFSVLTYRHGHFGPRVFGPLRSLWPSPVQSNWRVYVFDPGTGKAGVHFLTTAITSFPHALAARLLSEGVPMHVPARAEVKRLPDGAFEVLVDPGGGSAPDVSAELRRGGRGVLPGPWEECFGSWEEVLGYCMPQDRALSVRPGDEGCVVRQEIDLGIRLEECEPLVGRVTSGAARAIVGDAEPLCFHVPAVRFLYRGEEYDRPARG